MDCKLTEQRQMNILLNQRIFRRCRRPIKAAIWQTLSLKTLSGLYQSIIISQRRVGIFASLLGTVSLHDLLG